MFFRIGCSCRCCQLLHVWCNKWRQLLWELDRVPQDRSKARCIHIGLSTIQKFNLVITYICNFANGKDQPYHWIPNSTQRCTKWKNHIWVSLVFPVLLGIATSSDVSDQLGCPFGVIFHINTKLLHQRGGIHFIRACWNVHLLWCRLPDKFWLKDW